MTFISLLFLIYIFGCNSLEITNNDTNGNSIDNSGEFNIKSVGIGVLIGVGGSMICVGTMMILFCCIFIDKQEPKRSHEFKYATIDTLSSSDAEDSVSP
mmetsp:Transcript_15329/g.18756  ORF Transcript_15329/g.18756 Transcript_15329/m.18756 type:complete len:99 (+) Transcript_15329:32-328(+)